MAVLVQHAVGILSGVSGLGIHLDGLKGNGRLVAVTLPEAVII